MRAFWRGLRRFWIVTLGGGVRALNLLAVRGGCARGSTGIGFRPGLEAVAWNLGYGGRADFLAHRLGGPYRYHEQAFACSPAPDLGRGPPSSLNQLSHIVFCRQCCA